MVYVFVYLADFNKNTQREGWCDGVSNRFFLDTIRYILIKLKAKRFRKNIITKNLCIRCCFLYNQSRSCAKLRQHCNIEALRGSGGTPGSRGAVGGGVFRCAGG